MPKKEILKNALKKCENTQNQNRTFLLITLYKRKTPAKTSSFFKKRVFPPTGDDRKNFITRKPAAENQKFLRQKIAQTMLYNVKDAFFE